MYYILRKYEVNELSEETLVKILEELFKDETKDKA